MKKSPDQNQVVRLAKNTGATLIEHFVEPIVGASSTGALTKIVLEEGAQLRHYKIQDLSEPKHISKTSVWQKADSFYESHVFYLGGQPARNEINVTLAGSGAQASLRGLFLAQNKQISEHQTSVEHRAAHTKSQQIYKGLLADKARGIFSATAEVQEKAVRSEVEQFNKNILLSDEAQINSQPQLAIKTDDVKCRHGATTTQLPVESLFYLQSRGLSQGQANLMLSQAFANEMINKIEVESVRNLVREKVDQWLGARREFSAQTELGPAPAQNVELREAT